ncbi:MAG: LPS export ABC transporter periplasmic protein LptC [Deltaproteobacteria bacterium]|nr:MAG: LPS export ABC transporter periplasmic protein LptC [Deltaproteobacteria bacterium]
MTRKTTRLVLLVAISASLGGVGYKVAEQLWLMKSREFKKNPLKVLDYLPEAALQIKDFHRSQVDGNRKVWEIFGDEARYLKEEKQAVIKNPRILFYSKDGKTLEATGKEGNLFFTGEQTDPQGSIDRMQMRGDIQVSYQGFTFNTDELLYFKSKDQIVSPGRVTLKGDGMELEGVGMEIAIQDEKLHLAQNVKTKLQPDKISKKGKSQ